MEVIIDGVKYIPEPPAVIDTTLLAALEQRMETSDAGDNITVREYLHQLLQTLWNEGEGFSGKRPFGNSGWEYEVYKPLIAAGFIPGRLDEDGYVDYVDRTFAEDYIRSLITAMCYGVRPE